MFTQLHGHVREWGSCKVIHTLIKLGFQRRGEAVAMELGETPEELLELQDKILIGGLEAVAGSSSALISNSDNGGEVEKRAGGRRSREVMARPSGNNSLTFFMPDDEEEEEELAVVDAEDEDMDVDAVNSVGQGHEVDEEESVGDNQSLGDMPRERQLTQKFLAGQLSFKDLMQVLVCFRNAGLMPSSRRR